jgi:hypothetical protein
MFLSIVKVVDNRIAKFSEFESLEEAESHCEEHGGFVYEGGYSPELYVEDESVSIVPVLDTTDYSAKRANDYRNESDPLFFKWQRGEATEQEWLNKVAEIKARYPQN